MAAHPLWPWLTWEMANLDGRRCPSALSAPSQPSRMKNPAKFARTVQNFILPCPWPPRKTPAASVSNHSFIHWLVIMVTHVNLHSSSMLIGLWINALSYKHWLKVCEISPKVTASRRPIPWLDLSPAHLVPLAIISWSTEPLAAFHALIMMTLAMSSATSVSSYLSHTIQIYAHTVLP